MSPEERATLSRRERRHRDTRQEILAVARDLLLEVGPEEISLREVARRADFSPASLYTYFSSRDELIGALLTDSLQRLDAYLRRVPSELPPDKRVVELGMAYMDFSNENPVDLRCILMATRGGMPHAGAQATGMELAHLVGATFQEGVASGVFATTPDLTPAEMAYGFWALIHGIVSLGPLDVSDLVEIVNPAPRRVLEAFVARLRVTADEARAK